MQLHCMNCGYRWEYHGNAEYYASCPRCLRKVSLQKKTKKTVTSSFGVSKREAHDSSPFYRRRIFSAARPGLAAGEEGQAPDSSLLNRFFCRDSRDMSVIPDNSIHLMVTSPPYNVGKDYDENLGLTEYFQLLRDVFSETHRVLVPGGRACINIANVGRKPYIPYHKYIIDVMDDIGFLMRGEIIWNKGAGAGTSTAWGSFCSASNPVLRDVHEYILVFSKQQFKRDGGGKDSTIRKDDFLEYTKSIWTFLPESAKKAGHPAPFPEELPRRCIELFTFNGEIVLDPFCGIGSTALAAVRSGRRFVCFDNNPTYIERARSRIASLD